MITGDSVLYVQYRCALDENIMYSRRHQALITSCVAVFSALFTMAIVNYSQQTMHIDQDWWDLNTKTASDYTLQLFLTQKTVDTLRQS